MFFDRNSFRGKTILDDLEAIQTNIRSFDQE